MAIPDRANQRKPLRVSRATENIKADMARRAALPKDHPEYASPDSAVDDNKIKRKAPGQETDVPSRKR